MDEALTIRQLCSAIREQAVLREHCVREIIRTQNHMDAIGRVAEGRLKGKKADIPPDTQALYQAVALRYNPVFGMTLVAWTAQRKAIEKELTRLAKQLPCWPWVEHEVRGLGPLGLALIVGAATNHTGASLERFPNPSAFWKRMGLAVIDGERQRRIAGSTPERRRQAIVHGYSPTRRSLMFVISEALLKQNKGVYRQLYDERKAVELAKVPAEAKGRKGWAHRRALRYMVKRLLRHLWCVWQGRALEMEQAA
jgi:hypothetical protein